MMQRNVWLWIVVAALGLSLLTTVSSQGQNKPGPRPASVAVVNLGKIFENSDERGARRAEVSGQLEALQKEEATRRKELETLKTDLEILGPETDAHRQTIEKLESKAIEFDTWLQYQKRKLERESTLQDETLYRKIMEAVARIAKQDGYDVVLYMDSVDSVRSQTRQQLMGQIQTRRVLYAADGLDITDAVSQMLNNEYKNRAK